LEAERRAAVRPAQAQCSFIRFYFPDAFVILFWPVVFDGHARPADEDLAANKSGVAIRVGLAFLGLQTFQTILLNKAFAQEEQLWSGG